MIILVSYLADIGNNSNLAFLELIFKYNSVKVFSNILNRGTMHKKWPKYKIVLICPNKIKGSSTCLAPICINIKKLAIKIKKAILLRGLYCKPLDFPKSTKGKVNIINIALNIAKTPSNLFGIERRIA